MTTHTPDLPPTPNRFEWFLFLVIAVVLCALFIRGLKGYWSDFFQ